MNDSHELLTVALLRQMAAVEGVTPTDEDLEGVLAFLATILPALREIEDELPPETAVAGLYAPEGPR